MQDASLLHPSVNINRVWIILLLLILALPVVPAATQPAMPRAQPVLLQLAAAHPGDTVRVIVQKSGPGSPVEDLVLRQGGQVVSELSIINAFVAEISAGFARELALAAGVRWVSLDAGVTQSGAPISTASLQSAFVKAVGADRVWNEGPAYLQGDGIGVAVVDSGNCVDCVDLTNAAGTSRVVASMSVMSGPGDSKADDFYGHGSLVEGMIGANGSGLAGKYMGVAPGVNLVSVKIANNQGEALTSDVIAGLQWVLANKPAYNIRVVNLSLNSSTPESYMTNPLDAALEILWFNGIVVVVAAGNNGTATLYPPANDPFVITVGATDDRGTPGLGDDAMASFSAYGVTESGFSKPDLVAPGTNVISIVPRYKNKIWKDHSSNRTGEGSSNEYYMRVSGTSFAAPVVSGVAALLLQDEPNLTPDQVKFRLKATANQNWPGYSALKAGAGYLNAYAAIHGTSTQSANTGLPASQLLWTGGSPVNWGSVNWNSVNWGSVNWSSVNWGSVNWSSINWNSDYWE